MKLPTASAFVEKLPRVLRRHRLMTAWMRLTGEDTLQPVRIRGDSFGYADMAEGILRLVVIDGNFEHDFFRIADSILDRGGVFFDVGANHGLFSFGLAGKHPGRIEFHLFEPIPRLLRAIEKSRTLYPGMTVTVNAAAVADHDGEVSFEVVDEHTGVSHIDPAGALRTRCLKLDTYLKTNGMEQVHLLKMDIEGYELPAMRGAVSALKARTIKAIYFEYFEKNLVRVSPPQELIQFLDDVGYEVCLCREYDLRRAGPATHTLAEGLGGRGLPLIPVRGRTVPVATDLLAVPKEHLVAI